jgi:hypothetical protein
MDLYFTSTETPPFQISRSPTIADKLCRSYETKLPLELLAYFGIQPMNVGTPWAPGLERAVRARLEGSQFLRVWFFELSSGRIVVVSRMDVDAAADGPPPSTGPPRRGALVGS